MSSRELETRTRLLEACWQLMEQQRGLNVSMSAIAKKAGVSRQAVYLHFPSRTDLMIACTHYVDEKKGFVQRLDRFFNAQSSSEQIDALVEIWGGYIPEIYGLAKALILTSDTDEAAAVAWKGCMNCLHEAAMHIVKTLEQEGKLAQEWAPDDAATLITTLMSVGNWETLCLDGGWTNERYIKQMRILIKGSFVA